MSNLKSYSQNGEDIVVYNYFNGKIGAVLECGANDGKTFSNSKLLIDNGWSAYLLEPASVCAELFLLHKDNPKVHVFNYGIGDKEERVKFWESESHVRNGKDKALVSSTIYMETERWRKSGVKFNECEIQLVPFDNFWKYNDCPKFDFISIDCEGNDWQILSQIDLLKVDCSMLCIEWNGNNEMERLFSLHCLKFGMKEIYRNSENLIFAI